jgi:hypothetical protein
MSTAQGAPMESIASKKNILRAERDKNNPYYLIRRSSIQNPNLSWQAKGLLAYMLSMPDGWIFHQAELLKHSPNGLWSLKSCFKELKKAGHIKKNSIRDEGGKITHWETIVVETPADNLKEPEVGFQPTGSSSCGEHVENDTQVIDISHKLVSHPVEKPEGGKPTTIEETFIENKEDINKKSSSKQGNTNTYARASYSSSEIAAAAFFDKDNFGTRDHVSQMAIQFHERLKGTIDTNKLIDYIHHYGIKKIAETVELVLKRDITSKNSPGAFFNSALINDWVEEEKRAPRSNKQVLEGREEIIMSPNGSSELNPLDYVDFSNMNNNDNDMTMGRFVEWWRGMLDQGRETVLREVYTWHCYTEDMFKNRNINPLDASFVTDEKNQWAVRYLMKTLKDKKFI